MEKDERTTGKVIVKGVAQRLTFIRRNLASVRREIRIENCHDLSTSIRRILVTDKVLAALYGKRLISRKHRRELKSFRQILGRMRDLQEMSVKLGGLKLNNAFFRLFLESITMDSFQQKRKLLLNYLNISIVAGLDKKRVAGLVKQPLLTQPDDLMQQYFARAMMACKPSLYNSNESMLHQLRIKYKVYRYTVELFSPPSDDSHAPLSSLKALQVSLGEAHDWSVLGCEAVRFGNGRSLSGKEKTMSVISRQSAEAHIDARQAVASWEDRWNPVSNAVE